jgi:hypothetical protein
MREEREEGREGRGKRGMILQINGKALTNFLLYKIGSEGVFIS